MKIYTDQEIEKAFEWLEKHDGDIEEVFKDIDLHQPNLLAYVFSDSLASLSKNEKELLVFGILVLYKCTSAHNLGLITPDEIENAEAKNYDLVDEQLGYKEQIDIYFKDYPQEDLLAFVEDFMTSEEDEEFAVSMESKLPIFITLKTVIDVLT